MNQPHIFITLTRSPLERRQARLLVHSIRAFGGDLSQAPVWLFDTDPQDASQIGLDAEGIQIRPLPAADAAHPYYFRDKVLACARAEDLAGPAVQSLIWIDPQCLVVQPPLLFALDQATDAAVRPVHIRNVGLPLSAPLDSFWRGVYGAVGVPDVEVAVDSFVDGQRLRAYFNTHAFSINPARGVLARWRERFQSLVQDRRFQEDACSDELHQIFLHQAVLSALLATALQPQRLRILPPSYNYPYNLQARIPADRQAAALNDLVCFTYEGRAVAPDLVSDMAIREPLRSWLTARV